MQRTITYNLVLCLQIATASWISLHCRPDDKIKVKFHFDPDLKDGCVMTKELAMLLQIPVNEDGRNLYIFVNNGAMKVNMLTQSLKSLQREFNKIAIDDISRGLKLWIYHDEKPRILVEEGATSIHINEMRTSLGASVRRRFSRQKFKAFGFIFGPLLAEALDSSDILSLTSHTSYIAGLPLDIRLRLANQMISIREAIANQNLQQIMSVCIYILFKGPLGFRPQMCGLNGDHVYAALEATVELVSPETFARIGAYKELWNLLTADQKVALAYEAQYWTSHSLEFNEFFFQKFSCEGRIVLQNLSFVLDNPDLITSPSQMKNIATMMERYATIVNHQLVQKDIPHLSEVLRKSSELSFKATGLHILGWQGSFFFFFKHLKLYWPFVLRCDNPNLWLYQLDLSNSEKAPRLKDTIRYFFFLFQDFSESSSEDSGTLQFLTRNLEIYKTLSRDLFYESIEFYLYLSDFMILHSEMKTPFYNKVANYLLQLLEYDKDDFADALDLIKFLAELGLNRLLHIILDKTRICDETVERVKGEDLLDLFHAMTFDARCFIVFLDHFQPVQFFVEKFRKEFEIVPGSTIDAILAVYESETRLNIQGKDLANMEWDIPRILLDTSKIDELTQAVSLQCFLYKNLFISLDLSLVTHSCDEELSCSDYDMILNFVASRFMALHGKTKKIRITIPAVKEMEKVTLISEALELK